MNLLLFFLIEIGLLVFIQRKLISLRSRLEALSQEPPVRMSELRMLRRTILGRFVTEVVRDALLVTTVTLALLLFSVLFAEILGRAASDIWAGKYFLARVRSELLVLKPFHTLLSLSLGVVGLFWLARRAAAATGLHASPLLRQAQERSQQMQRENVIRELAASDFDPRITKKGEPWDTVWLHPSVVKAGETLDQTWGRSAGSESRSSASRPWSDEFVSQLYQDMNHSGTSSDLFTAFREYVQALEEFRFAAAVLYVDEVNNPDRQHGSEGAPSDATSVIGKALINQSLHRGLRRTNRLAYYASLALLVPAWVGVIGNSSLRTASVRLTDLAITRQEAARQAEATSQAETERPAKPTTKLTDNDRQLIQRIARQWEQKTFDNPPLDPTNAESSLKVINQERPGWLTAEYEMRSGISREAILFEAAEDANGPRTSNGRPHPNRKKRYEWATVGQRSDDGDYFSGDTSPPEPGSPEPGPAGTGPRKDGPVPNGSDGSGANSGGGFFLGGSEEGGPFAAGPTGPKPGSPQPGSPSPVLALSASGASALSGIATKSPDAQQVRAFLTAFEQPFATQNPVTEAGNAVKVELEKECRRSKSFLAHLRTQFASTLPPPSMRTGEVRGIVIASIVDALFHVVSEGPVASGDLGPALWAFTSASPGEVVDLRDAQRAKAAQAKDALFREIRRGSSASVAYDAVGKAARHSDDLIRPVGREARARLEVLFAQDNVYAAPAEVFIQQPPSIRDEMEAGVDEKAVKAIIENELQAAKKNSSADRPFLASTAEQKTEALVVFDDYFPGYPGADDATQRGVLRKAYFPDPPSAPEAPAQTFAPVQPIEPSGLIENVVDLLGSLASSSGNSPSRVPPRIVVEPSLSTPGRGRAARARSFMRLRGFTRVGGVLIGREPDKQGAVSFKDLRWRWTSGGKIILTLVDANGKATDSAPYRADLVLKALQYAADGRATTVTMVSAEPIPSLRILLHPTLVDTPIGAQIQQLDRLVDTYTLTGATTSNKIRMDSEVGVLRQKVMAHAQLQMEFYAAAWVLQAYRAHPKWLGGDTAPPQITALKSKYASSLTELVGSEADGLIPQYIREALKVMDDPKACPLASHPELYNDGVLAAMAAVAQSTSPTWGELRLAIETINVDVAKPPVEWIPWSGVREKTYRITANDLLMPQGEESQNLPFEFMWQIAFETDNEQKNINPWEHPKLATLIKQEVPSLIASKPQFREDPEVIRTSREFTFLQRLFRTAFQGWLGPQFSVQSLVELHRSVRDHSPVYERTLRWNAAPTRKMIQTEKIKLQRVLSLLQSVDAKTQNRYRDDISRASNQIGQYEKALRLYDALRIERDADQIALGRVP